MWVLGVYVVASARSHYSHEKTDRHGGLSSFHSRHKRMPSEIGAVVDCGKRSFENSRVTRRGSSDVAYNVLKLWRPSLKFLHAASPNFEVGNKSPRHELHQVKYLR